MQSAIPPTPWYRQFWPWFIMALPASAVIAGIATVIIATQNRDSLVADDYYKEGLAINQSIEREQVAAQLEMQALLRFSNDAQPLSLQLTSRQQDALPETLTLSLTHPTLDQLDHEIQLMHQGNGLYIADTTASTTGVWQARLEPTERNWRLTGRINLAQGGQQLLSANY